MAGKKCISKSSQEEVKTACTPRINYLKKADEGIRKTRQEVEKIEKDMLEAHRKMIFLL
jgi:hypothetical protein